MPRTRSDASAYSLWGQASLSRGTSFGWVHGDRHEACHPHTSRFFPVLVLRLRRLNYEHPSFFFIRSYLLCLIRPAFGGSARGAHGRRSCPELFPLTSLGQVARNATRRGRLEGRRDGGRGRPNPGSRPERRPSIAGQKTSPAGAPPHSKLRTEQWADRPMPVQRANLCSCFLHVNSVDGCERLLSACRQEIGYFSLHLLRCSSVHLIDRRLATEQVCGAVWVVSRSPYSGQLLPAWGKRVKSCGFGPVSKGLLIKAFQARSTTQRHNDQVR
jgi:hypothetical protein